MHCDVDLLGETLSGMCVFSTAQPEGGPCINIPPTESCPPGLTCIDGNECKEVCLCDSDCEPGNCCTTPLGDRGFKTCSKC
jgi:hypothetical protein